MLHETQWYNATRWGVTKYAKNAGADQSGIRGDTGAKAEWIRKMTLTRCRMHTITSIIATINSLVYVSLSLRYVSMV